VRLSLGVAFILLFMTISLEVLAGPPRIKRFPLLDIEVMKCVTSRFEDRVDYYEGLSGHFYDDHYKRFVLSEEDFYKRNYRKMIYYFELYGWPVIEYIKAIDICYRAKYK